MGNDTNDKVLLINCEFSGEASEKMLSVFAIIITILASHL